MATKSQVIDAFVKALFEPEGRRIERMVTELDKTNREVSQSGMWGFMWNGQPFLPSCAPHRPNRFQTLHFSLRHEGDALLKDMKIVEDDKKMIRQMLNLLVKNVDTVEEVRNALPDAVVEMSREMYSYPRTREAGYTLQDDRQQRQFIKMLDKIEFYAATRLMY